MNPYRAPLAKWNKGFSAEVLEAAMPALVWWYSSISQRTIVLFVYYITDVNNLMIWLAESALLWHGAMPARFRVAGSLLSRSKEIRVDFKSIYIRTFGLCLHQFMQDACCTWKTSALKSYRALRGTKCCMLMGSGCRGRGRMASWPICTNHLFLSFKSPWNPLWMPDVTIRHSKSTQVS